MNDIEIRLAAPSDAKALCLLNKEFNGENNTPEETELALYLENAPETILVAVYRENLAGFITGNIARSLCWRTAHGEICELFVSGLCRRRGIGQMLIEAMEHFFKENGISVVTLYTSQTNLSAQAFYEQCGYLAKQRIEYLKRFSESAKT